MINIYIYKTPYVVTQKNTRFLYVLKKFFPLMLPIFVLSVVPKQLFLILFYPILSIFFALLHLTLAKLIATTLISVNLICLDGSTVNVVIHPISSTSSFPSFTKMALFTFMLFFLISTVASQIPASNKTPVLSTTSRDIV